MKKILTAKSFLPLCGLLASVSESSPDTPKGSVSSDLNLSKLWLFKHLEPLVSEPFEHVYILGSWYGSIGVFLLTSRIKFDRAFLVELDWEKVQFTDHVLKRMKIDNVESVHGDCNRLKYSSAPSLVINTSTNDITGREWFERIPPGTLTALQGKSNQEFESNGIDTYEKFVAAYPLSETRFKGFLTLNDVKGEPYQRFMTIGIK